MGQRLSHTPCQKEHAAKHTMKPVKVPDETATSSHSSRAAQSSHRTAQSLIHHGMRTLPTELPTHPPWPGDSPHRNAQSLIHRGMGTLPTEVPSHSSTVAWGLSPQSSQSLIHRGMGTLPIEVPSHSSTMAWGTTMRNHHEVEEMGCEGFCLFGWLF